MRASRHAILGFLIGSAAACGLPAAAQAAPAPYTARVVFGAGARPIPGLVTMHPKPGRVPRDVQGPFSGDGGPAVNARAWGPNVIDARRDGTYAFADARNNRIRQVTPDGIVRTIAGSGLPASPACGWGVPAAQACLSVPHGVTYGSGGTILITNTFAGVVLRVGADGVARRIAGNGSDCDLTFTRCGEGGPALNASLHWPTIARDTPKGVVIADTANRVLLVGRDGIIRRIAGTGKAGFSGDGGPADKAQLWAPADAIPYQGGWLISDGNNCRIRRVDARGIIRPFAGYGGSLETCWQGYALAASPAQWGAPLPAGTIGDGGSALKAKMQVTGFLAASGSTVYVPDWNNRRLRMIKNGRISTILGTGQPDGVNGAGPMPGPSMRTGRLCAAALVPGASKLLVTDCGVGRVIEVTLPR